MLVLRKTYNRLKELYEHEISINRNLNNINAQLKNKVTSLSRELQILEQQLKIAQKNDARDARGRFTKRKEQ